MIFLSTVTISYSCSVSVNEPKSILKMSILTTSVLPKIDPFLSLFTFRCEGDSKQLVNVHWTDSWHTHFMLH